MPHYKIIFKLIFLSCIAYANQASAHTQEGTLGKTTTGAAATCA